MTRGRTFYPDRRNVLRAAAIALATPSLGWGAEAQTRKVPVVGFLAPRPLNTSAYPELRSHLQDLGYVDGISLRLVGRSGDASLDLDALSGFAADLVREGADVIVTQGRLATLAARRATDRIPIVILGAGGADEFVSNLSRPEGNITGFVLRQDKTDVKLVEILRQAVPQVSKLAILKSHDGGSRSARAIAEVAGAYNIDTFVVDVASVDNLERAFASMAAQQANGLLFIVTSSLFPFREQIASLALTHRLPATASSPAFATAGFLITYYADERDFPRQAAGYVDRLIKGAKPADLPVQEPTLFKMVVNLKTAAKLGLTVPPLLLAQADELIE